MNNVTITQTNRLLLPLLRKAVMDAVKAGYFMAPSSRSANGPYRVTIVAGRAVACTCRGYNFDAVASVA
jgi:hypothetical protein